VHAGIDLGMPLLGLRHSEQCIHFGKDAPKRAAGAQRFDVDVGAVRCQRFNGLLPDALRAQRLHLAGCDDVFHELERFSGDREVERCETRGEACHAQHTQRILAKCRRHVSQNARFEVGSSRPRVDDLAVLAAGDGVDGEVAALEVVFERHRRRGIERKAGISRRGLTLDSSECVFFAGARVQEYRKILADAPIALCDELVGRSADDDPIALRDG
jgi:hypothetical protein